MNGMTLFMGLLTGTIGTGYFIYGKKQQKLVPIFCGIALCIVPYFIENIAFLACIAVGICMLPFVVKTE